ncbi:hypothetical protein O3P69_003834 [Scylla paramamosain]|uniref:Uncharacterized protein n=1 Tax=Scylla paramamosain TaxID=85552 RepID=A0AAW0UGY7_SCYPA
MGGQVEAIVLSPAPGEEEATQDGGFQERPDQELWRQGDQEEKDPQEGQDSQVSGKDDGGKKEKEDTGGGNGEDSKDAEDKARQDGDSNNAGRAEFDGGKVTEGTAKDESNKKPALEDRSGNKKRKGSGGRDDKPHSVEIRIHPPNAKRISTSKRQATNTKNANTAQKKVPSSSLKPSKMRDGEERGSKLPSPERGSRGASPEQGRNKSPGSGRASPHGGRQGSDVDEKAKSIISKTSDSDKDAEESNKNKTNTGGGGGGGEVPRDAPPASHPRKPPVEDRALQAILAARRRSLENAGKAEPRRNKTEEDIKAKQSEEAKRQEPATVDPPPWMAGAAVLWHRYCELQILAHLAHAAARNNDEGGGGEDSARTLKGKMVNRFVVTELRQKRKLMGHLGAPGREEVYCDKDRAAAVAMGDQDIKTSLKVGSVTPEPVKPNTGLTCQGVLYDILATGLLTRTVTD